MQTKSAVAANGELAAKFKPADLTVSQTAPEFSFGLGGILAEVAGEGRAGADHHPLTLTLSPPGRGSALPPAGQTRW